LQGRRLKSGALAMHARDLRFLRCLDLPRFRGVLSVWD